MCSGWPGPTDAAPRARGLVGRLRLPVGRIVVWIEWLRGLGEVHVVRGHVVGHGILHVVEVVVGANGGGELVAGWSNVWIARGGQTLEEALDVWVRGMRRWAYALEVILGHGLERA